MLVLKYDFYIISDLRRKVQNICHVVIFLRIADDDLSHFYSMWNACFLCFRFTYIFLSTMLRDDVIFFYLEEWAKVFFFQMNSKDSTDNFFSKTVVKLSILGKKGKMTILYCLFMWLYLQCILIIFFFQVCFMFNVYVLRHISQKTDFFFLFPSSFFFWSHKFFILISHFSFTV